MMSKYSNKERKGLPGGPNEMFSYTTGVFSQTPSWFSNGPSMFAQTGTETKKYLPKAQQGIPFEDVYFTGDNDPFEKRNPREVLNKLNLNSLHPGRETYTDANIEAQRQEALDWINSPGFLKVAGKSYSNPELEQRKRAAKVKNTPYELVDKIGNKRGFVNGLYDWDEQKILLENSGYKGIPLEEFNHSSVYDGEKIRLSTRELNGINRSIKDGVSDYYKDPAEVQNRVMLLRKVLKDNNVYDYNKDTFNTIHLKKLKEEINKHPEKFKYGQIKDLLKSVKTDADLIWLMNNLTSIEEDDGTRMAQEGMETKKYLKRAQRGYDDVAKFGKELNGLAYNDNFQNDPTTQYAKRGGERRLKRYQNAGETGLQPIPSLSPISEAYRKAYGERKIAEYLPDENLYIAQDLPESESTGQAPNWLLAARAYEEVFPKPQKGEMEYEWPHAIKMTHWVNGRNKVIVEAIEKDRGLSGNKTKRDVEIINSLPIAEQRHLSRAPKYQTSTWKDVFEGVKTFHAKLDPLNTVTQRKIQIKNDPYLTNLEKKERLQALESNPELTLGMDMFQGITSLGMEPAKLVQAAYKKDYSLGDALRGRKNYATIVEDAISEIPLAGMPSTLEALGMVGRALKPLAKSGRRLVRQATPNTRARPSIYVEPYMGPDGIETALPPEVFDFPAEIREEISALAKANGTGALSDVDYNNKVNELYEQGLDYLRRREAEGIPNNAQPQLGQQVDEGLPAPQQTMEDFIPDEEIEDFIPETEIDNAVTTPIINPEPNFEMASNIDNTSLTITSLLGNTNLTKQVNKKGNINANNLKAYINSQSTPRPDKFILEKVFKEKFADQKNINFEEFKNAVESELVPFEKLYSDTYKSYGSQNLYPKLFELQNAERNLNNYKSQMADKIADATKKINQGKQDINKIQIKEETDLEYHKDRIKFYEKELEYTIEQIESGEDFRNGRNLKNYLEDIYANLEYHEDGIKKTTDTLANMSEADKLAKRERAFEESKWDIFIYERKIEKLEKDLAEFRNYLDPNYRTLLFKNDEAFGIGSDSHFDERPLAHSRVANSPYDPDAMLVLEQQSDYFQDKDNIRPNFGDIYTNTKIDDLTRQREIVGKNIYQRLIQENIIEAVNTGKKKILFPTMETTQKIQGYQKTLEQVRAEIPKLKETLADKKVVGSEREHFKEQLKFHLGMEAVYRRARDLGKEIKKATGEKVNIITDPEGNTWYEMNIPQSFLEGTGKIKAFKRGGERRLQRKGMSRDGYKRYSPDVNNPYNIIPSGNITMEDVDFPILGIDNYGNEQVMTPGGNYTFPGDTVLEFPIAQRGAETGSYDYSKNLDFETMSQYIKDVGMPQAWSQFNNAEKALYRQVMRQFNFKGQPVDVYNPNGVNAEYYTDADGERLIQSAPIPSGSIEYEDGVATPIDTGVYIKEWNDSNESRPKNKGMAADWDKRRDEYVVSRILEDNPTLLERDVEAMNKLSKNAQKFLATDERFQQSYWQDMVDGMLAFGAPAMANGTQVYGMPVAMPMPSFDKQKNNPAQIRIDQIQSDPNKTDYEKEQLIGQYQTAPILSALGETVTGAFAPYEFGTKFAQGLYRPDYSVIDALAGKRTQTEDYEQGLYDVGLGLATLGTGPLVRNLAKRSGKAINKMAKRQLEALSEPLAKKITKDIDSNLTENVLKDNTDLTDMDVVDVWNPINKELPKKQEDRIRQKIENFKKLAQTEEFQKRFANLFTDWDIDYATSDLLGDAIRRKYPELPYNNFTRPWKKPYITPFTTKIDYKITNVDPNTRKKIDELFLPYVEKFYDKNNPDSIVMAIEKAKEELTKNNKSLLKDIFLQDRMKSILELDLDDVVKRVNNSQYNPVTNTISMHWDLDKNLDAILEHELGHGLSTFYETEIDKRVKETLKPEFIKKTSPPGTYKGLTRGEDEAINRSRQNDTWYMFGSRNEPTAFMRETRQNMLEDGFIDDIFQPITPEIVERANKYYTANYKPSVRFLYPQGHLPLDIPRGRFFNSTDLTKARPDVYSTKTIEELAKDGFKPARTFGEQWKINDFYNKDNRATYEFVADLFNRLPQMALPTALGAGAIKAFMNERSAVDPSTRIGLPTYQQRGETPKYDFNELAERLNNSYDPQYGWDYSVLTKDELKFYTDYYNKNIRKVNGESATGNSSAYEFQKYQKKGEVKPPSYEQYRDMRFWWESLTVPQREMIHMKMMYPEERGILSEGDKLYKDRYNAEYSIPVADIKETSNPRIFAQNESIIENEGAKNQNYAILDKKTNTIAYYDSNNRLISTEPVITGTDNKDRDYSISMRDWYEDDANKGKTHDDYFKFLEETEGKITPSGHFTIAQHRTDVNKNPGSVQSKLWNVATDAMRGRPLGTRNRDIVASRTRDYGDGNMFTLKSDAGLYSSKAIHSTGNEKRINAFNANGSPETRDMSNGCINVNGKTICFDTLEKGSSVYILPEESNDLVKRGSKVPYATRYYDSKQRINNSLKNRGLEFDEDLLNFLSAVHGKESKHGTDVRIPYEDMFPSIFHSDGEFQINRKSFKKYLPKNYTGTFDDQVEAVYNFYNAHKDKYTPSQMYSIYNSGRVNKHLKTLPLFNKIHENATNTYQRGGEVNSFKYQQPFKGATYTSPYDIF